MRRNRRAWVAVLLALAAAPQTWAMEVIAHRGANQLAPENTQAAVQKCIDLGVDYVEVDVMLSKDGGMYNIHDLSVNRTTNGKGLIASLTSAQIDALDAGSWFSPQFAGERVPRYDTFLPWIKDKIKINFDVRFADMEKLVQLVRENHLELRSFFHFWNPTMAHRFRGLAPDLVLKADVSTPEDAECAAAELGARIVETGLPSLTPAFWKVCHKWNLKVICCAHADDRDEYRKILASGADMAMVNRPDLFLAVAAETK